MDEEADKEFADALTTLKAIKHAVTTGLQIEFLVFFLREIKAGRSVDEAVHHANTEWDL